MIELRSMKETRKMKEIRRMNESRRIKETKKINETREMRKIDNEMKMIEKTNRVVVGLSFEQKFLLNS
jgi:hypothetical protein